MAGREIVNRQVNIYIQSGDAQKAYDTLISKEKQLNAELAKTTDPKRMQKLRDDLKALEEPISRASKKLSGELAPSLKDVEAAARRTRNELSRMSQNDPAFAEKLKQHRAFTAQLNQMRAEMGQLNAAQSSLGKLSFFQASFWANLAARGISVATNAIGGFFRTAVDEALNADEATQRLQSTLDNLGRGDAFDRITRKADEMAEKFRYLDNDDVVGVFNKLIDYGKLTEKEMNALLPVIIDFAAKNKMGLEESTDVIVKALEGNGKALKQYGIDIKDTGNETERLNVIMTTLKDKVQGSAEAFQNSAKGGIMTARQELMNVAEDIGNYLIPVLSKLLGWIVKALNGLKSFFKDIKDGFRDSFSLRGIANQALDRAKETGQRNIPKIFEEVNQAIADAIELENSKKPLGLPPDKPSGSSKSLKEKKKEVDELVHSIKNLGDVIDKELSKRNADINADNIVGKGLEFAKGIEDRLAGIRGQQNIERVAFLELQIYGKRGLARLAAEKKLLTELRDQELANTTLTENQKELIRNKYRALIQDKENQFAADFLENLANYGQMAANLINTFSSVSQQADALDLERDRVLNEKKKSNLEKRLQSGKISRQDYEREMEKIDRDREKKERAAALRQFAASKRANIAQATIDGIMAVSQVIRTVPKVIPGTVVPNPQFPIILGATIASKLLTIAAIAAQKPPQFARGGQLGGARHSEGGNPILDGKTGQKIAEIEQGEGIINRHSMADRRNYTVSGTPSQIASMINGLGGGVQWNGGGRLLPGWYSRPPALFNYAAIKRYYATGGTFGAGSGTAGMGSENAEMMAVLGQMQQTNDQLVALLNRGIVAVASLTQFNDQQARLDAIDADRTMR